MKRFAQFAEDARSALKFKEYHWLSRLMNDNFDLRASLYRLSEKNHQLVQTARALGCSSKFAGSGGAVIGILPDESIFPELEKAYVKMGAKAIRPIIV
jgi:glucuronokinase